jgi:hypothetical protein
MTRKAIGTEDINIKSRAGTAARAKKASEVADQIEVASVLKPMGLRSSVAGSSFMVVRKTRAAPAKIPGRTRGRVTVTRVCNGVRPRLRAASSTRGLT